MRTGNTIEATDLRAIQAEQPGAFLVATETYGKETRLYGPFATKQDAQDWGQESFGGADFTGGVRWMVYDISAAVDRFVAA